VTAPRAALTRSGSFSVSRTSRRRSSASAWSDSSSMSGGVPAAAGDPDEMVRRESIRLAREPASCAAQFFCAEEMASPSRMI
jgi:hypothetical protein